MGQSGKYCLIKRRIMVVVVAAAAACWWCFVGMWWRGAGKLTATAVVAGCRLLPVVRSLLLLFITTDLLLLLYVSMFHYQTPLWLCCGPPYNHANVANHISGNGNGRDTDMKPTMTLHRLCDLSLCFPWLIMSLSFFDFFFLLVRGPPRSTLFRYTSLFGPRRLSRHTWGYPWSAGN